MADRPLEGKRIAVLVETEFIPAEIEAYERVLSSFGAHAEFFANVRPNRRIHIVSDVDAVVYENPQGGPDHSEVDLEATRRRLEVREVTGDISEQLARVSWHSAPTTTRPSRNARAANRTAGAVRTMSAATERPPAWHSLQKGRPGQAALLGEDIQAGA